MFPTTTIPDYWQFVPEANNFNWSNPAGVGVIGILVLSSLLLLFAAVSRLRLRFAGKGHPSDSEASASIALILLAFGGMLAFFNATAKPHISASGETRSESLQSWVQDKYELDISEEGADQLIDRANDTWMPPKPLVISYDGEYIKVSLVQVDEGDDAYILVEDGTLKPLPVPVDK